VMLEARLARVCCRSSEPQQKCILMLIRSPWSYPKRPIQSARTPKNPFRALLPLGARPCRTGKATIQSP